MFILSVMGELSNYVTKKKKSVRNRSILSPPAFATEKKKKANAISHLRSANWMWPLVQKQVQCYSLA